MKLANLFTLLLTAGLMLTACKNETTPSVKMETTAPIDDQMVIDTFSTIPGEIKNCSCMLGNSSDEISNGKYVFVDDNASIAFMKIKGNRETLKLSQRDTTDSGSKKIFGNDNYQVTVELSPKTNGNTKSQVNGTIKVLRNDRKEVTLTVQGTCGC